VWLWNRRGEWGGKTGASSLEGFKSRRRERERQGAWKNLCRHVFLRGKNHVVHTRDQSAERRKRSVLDLRRAARYRKKVCTNEGNKWTPCSKMKSGAEGGQENPKGGALCVSKNDSLYVAFGRKGENHDFEKKGTPIQKVLLKGEDKNGLKRRITNLGTGLG